MAANPDYLRLWVDTWNRGDVGALLNDASPEIEWVVAREHPAAATHSGPQEVAAYLADWLRTMPDFHIEILELEEFGDRVLLVMRVTGTGAGSGAATEVRNAMVSTFKDGKPIRVEEFLDPEEARRALAVG